jgi:deoxyribodipyrimidine photo-lyase
MDPCVVWLRNDLRLADNPALTAALARGGPVVPVFIWAPGEEGDWTPGAASQWWLHQSLQSLRADLESAGARLVVRHVRRDDPHPARQSTLSALQTIAKELGAGAIFWNRRYEPAAVARDTRIKQSLKAASIDAQTFNAQLLYEPWGLRTQAGQPFRVFSHFWRACLAAPEPADPTPAPARFVERPARWPDGEPIEALGLLPTVDWTGGLRATWRPGERSALDRLALFAESAVSSYADARDTPATAGTSRLSPHLHFGEVSPRQIWWAMRDATATRGDVSQAGTDAFLRELGWREFSHHLLFHFPDTTDEPMRVLFASFPWLSDPSLQQAWQRGRTGYPLVDAGMRELWQTGFMHNRVRMVAASFLVKHLLQPWQAGARWFWDTLVDADLAQNTLGWQWVAGSGADAAPFFRVFNPVLQGRRFDAEGAYIRAYVPELARLPNAYLHAPWTCPDDELRRAGVTLDGSYPRPIVDHVTARRRALTAYQTL